ncbi:MAG TPA: putative metal-dependent hydrolase [Chitinophaga sp.]|uniref:YfiT family bacillithiol transferase n=1 Tax=Chitinophaga sp. TaxID=1869181 RepID=UPI002C73C79C|nr:putative metal-dependent hydrolase [Chitinophaga sp.]HVI49372.1 putative metal-dependent hydrolase [Chitinophaga sp.]
MEALKYPIGRFEALPAYTPEMVKGFIEDIRELPTLVELEIQRLDEYQLQTPYRPGGWTLAQVVHHLADSHINAITRMKLALTEDCPVIKPYEEAAWAELPDVAHTPINVSITLLHALHTRWTNLMDRLSPEQWERTFRHPDYENVFNLKTQAANYSWHGKHHLEHIRGLKERMHW